MRGTAETIRTAVDATTIAIDRVVEGHVGAIVGADDRAGFRFFKNFDLRRRRLADPFDRVSQPGIGWIIDEAHICNSVLSMKQSISDTRLFGEYFCVRHPKWRAALDNGRAWI